MMVLLDYGAGKLNAIRAMLRNVGSEEVLVQ